MKEIAIYGFGGFGREVACLIRKINERQPRWKFIGYFDDGHASGERNAYGEVLGDMETLNGWPRELDVAFAIGSAPVLRRLTARRTPGGISEPCTLKCFRTPIDRQFRNEVIMAADDSRLSTLRTFLRVTGGYEAACDAVAIAAMIAAVALPGRGVAVTLAWLALVCDKVTDPLADSTDQA